MAQYNLPPRQKMINLLYVILIAMLAINISSDVLDGIGVASDDLEKDIKSLKEYNKKLNLTGNDGSDKAETVQKAVEGFALELMKMKEDIRNEAMKSSLINSNTDIDDDLNAVQTVMLGPDANAAKVKTMMEQLKRECLSLLDNEDQRKLVADLLNTDVTGKEKSWEQEHFENSPSVGGIMMLNLLEKNMWMAVNETLKEVKADGTNSKKDKEEKPDNSNVADKEVKLDNDLVKVLIAQLQKNTANGGSNRIVNDKNGKILAVVMTENQTPLFANFENKLNVTVAAADGGKTPYVVKMTNGTVKNRNGQWVAIPDAETKEVTLTVTAGNRKLSEKTYAVIPLPTPVPYLLYQSASGKTREYRSNVPLNAQELASINEISLHMEGVNTQETVCEFDMIVVKNGNKTVMIEHAKGNRLTDNMKKVLKNVVRGDKLFFTNIMVKAENTSARQTASVNVIPM